MKNNERLKHRNKAAYLVGASSLFKEPTIDFILYDTVQEKTKYLIGVTDQHDIEKRYVYIPTQNNKLLPLHKIHYHSKKEKRLFDECVEGYILLSMDKGYEPAFMSIPVHIAIWEFIETYLSEVNYMRNAVLKYLAYCRGIGINRLLLSHYYGNPVTNLFPLFVDDTNAENHIIVTHRIGNTILSLYYIGELKQDTIFIVEASHIESGETTYHDYFSELRNAYIDFMRLFYEHNITYHKKVIDDLDNIIEDFSEYFDLYIKEQSR